MIVLAIDPKDNCYVIDTNGMNNLQNNIASSITLDRGTYTVQITSGRYSYSADSGPGEPSVVLWMYANEGSTFINKNTGFETGATWTTLNGYNDTLTLEVKDKITICGLFFDLYSADNSGSITLSIGRQGTLTPPKTLTVDSQKNCQQLDEGYLNRLKQSGGNFIELPVGQYEIKIRPDSNVTYWSEEQKFKLEPWALLWVCGGKFISKLTNVEVGESWLSLNGFQDRVMLTVKEKTTLCGLFIDTFKEDNTGKMYVTVDPVVVPVSQTPTTASTSVKTTPTSVSSTSATYRTYSTTTTVDSPVSYNWDDFPRNPEQDIVCVSPIRTVVRREEEILIIRKVRKVEEVDASPSCPTNTTQVSPDRNS